MAVFAKVVDEGSFRAAAKKLSLAPSRISQTVSDLERYLGTTLLYRTTRKLTLTNEGRKFYHHVEHILKSAEAGLNELNGLSQEPSGALKISLPAFLAYSHISSFIAEFAQQHPKVSLSLHYSDQVMDILNEGLDLSIRVGWLQDSSMMVRKLYEGKRMLVASKEYIANRPPPQHPSDLEDWDWIRFDVRPSTVELVSTSGESVIVSENARFSVNSASALTHFTKQGLGVTFLPENLIEDDIKTGKLVHLLSDWTLESLSYYAIWPSKSLRENLTLLLVRFLAERCHTGS